MEMNLEYYSSIKSETALHVQGQLMQIGGLKISDMSLQAKPHEFKNTSFTIPTSCDCCRQIIWGVNKPGYTCKGK